MVHGHRPAPSTTACRLSAVDTGLAELRVAARPMPEESCSKYVSNSSPPGDRATHPEATSRPETPTPGAGPAARARTKFASAPTQKRMLRGPRCCGAWAQKPPEPAWCETTGVVLREARRRAAPTGQGLADRRPTTFFSAITEMFQCWKSSRPKLRSRETRECGQHAGTGVGAWLRQPEERLLARHAAPSSASAATGKACPTTDSLPPMWHGPAHTSRQPLAASIRMRCVADLSRAAAGTIFLTRPTSPPLRM